MHPNSYVLGTAVIGCEAKHELSKKGFAGGNSGCEISVFVKEKEGHLLFTWYLVEKLDKRHQKTQNTSR